MIDPYVPKDAYDLLADGPVRPDQIDIVMLSHMHFDHSGDVGRFPHAQVMVGPGTRDCIQPGYPTADGSPFDGSVLVHQRFSELKRSDYKRFKADSVPTEFPFQEGVDIFDDGSFFILDAPGHMPGHQMARKSPLLPKSCSDLDHLIHIVASTMAHANGDPQWRGQTRTNGWLWEAIVVTTETCSKTHPVRLVWMLDQMGSRDSTRIPWMRGTQSIKVNGCIRTKVFSLHWRMTRRLTGWYHCTLRH